MNNILDSILRREDKESVLLGELNVRVMEAKGLNPSLRKGSWVRVTLSKRVLLETTPLASKGEMEWDEDCNVQLNGEPSQAITVQLELFRNARGVRRKSVFLAHARIQLDISAVFPLKKWIPLTMADSSSGSLLDSVGSVMGSMVGRKRGSAGSIGNPEVLVRLNFVPATSFLSSANAAAEVHKRRMKVLGAPLPPLPDVRTLPDEVSKRRSRRNTNDLDLNDSREGLKPKKGSGSEEEGESDSSSSSGPDLAAAFADSGYQALVAPDFRNGSGELDAYAQDLAGGLPGSAYGGRTQMQFGYSAMMLPPPGSSSDDDDSTAEEVSRDWKATINGRFQELVEQLRLLEFRSATGDNRSLVAEKLSVCEDLVKVAEDFVANAEQYGKIIVSEFYLPDEEKTIKPTKLGGSLGGKKYRVFDLLFKVPEDGLFRGTAIQDSEAAAMKVCGHELKGLSALWSSGVAQLFFPLMALIDYKGYRLLCMSFLPLSDSSIVYGCADAAHSKKIHYEPQFARYVSEACRMLGLAEHTVGSYRSSKKKKSKKVFQECEEKFFSPIDLEGHNGLDGRNYLIDFSRVLPPTPPEGPMDYVYKLFRSEFCASYSRMWNISLSSDAFSPFAPPKDPEGHDAAVVAAGKFLTDKHIPSVAKDFEELWKGKVRFSVSEEMHRRGVNMRMLGTVTGQVKDATLSTYLLLEGVARVTKNVLRKRMRDTLRSEQTPLEAPLRTQCVAFINSLFASSTESAALWQAIQEGMPSLTFSADPVRDRVCKAQFDDVSGRYLFLQRLCEMSGITIAPEILHSCKVDDSIFDSGVLVDFADLTLTTRVKHLNVVDRANGTVLLLRGMAEQSAAAARYFSRAEACFNRALKASPTDATLLGAAADCCYFRGLSCKDDTLLSKALRYYEAAVEVAPSNVALRTHLARLLGERGETERAEEEYLKALALNPHQIQLLQRYSLFVQTKPKVTDADQEFVSQIRTRSKALVLLHSLAMMDTRQQLSQSDWDEMRWKLRSAALSAAFASALADSELLTTVFADTGPTSFLLAFSRALNHTDNELSQSTNSLRLGKKGSRGSMGSSGSRTPSRKSSANTGDFTRMMKKKLSDAGGSSMTGLERLILQSPNRIIAKLLPEMRDNQEKYSGDIEAWEYEEILEMLEEGADAFTFHYVMLQPLANLYKMRIKILMAARREQGHLRSEYVPEDAEGRPLEDEKSSPGGTPLEDSNCAQLVHWTDEHWDSMLKMREEELSLVRLGVLHYENPRLVEVISLKPFEQMREVRNKACHLFGLPPEDFQLEGKGTGFVIDLHRSVENTSLSLKECRYQLQLKSMKH